LAVLGVLGFMFREKWKQILQRSLTEGIERQRHKLQQELEAYKVSLIAQAEVLARTDASERAADVAKAAEWCPTGTC
jgi:hypothetical protein